MLSQSRRGSSRRPTAGEASAEKTALPAPVLQRRGKGRASAAARRKRKEMRRRRRRRRLSELVHWEEPPSKQQMQFSARPMRGWWRDSASSSVFARRRRAEEETGRGERESRSPKAGRFLRERAFEEESVLLSRFTLSISWSLPSLLGLRSSISCFFFFLLDSSFSPLLLLEPDF